VAVAEGLVKVHFHYPTLKFFFFLIFGFTFSMIVWTVKSAVDTPVYEDKSFMSNYHIVDDNYNQMIIDNHNFNSKYDTKITINNRTIDMGISDILYGQRSLKKKSTNQNMLVVGNNSISIKISKRGSSTIISDANISIQITRAIEDSYDINLNKFKFVDDIYSLVAKVGIEGNWNIIGKIAVGDDTGYLYIKTNTER
jgi:hypothetical protein